MTEKDFCWNALIIRYKGSGMIMREFCEQNGVVLSRFKYHWYKQNPADRALACKSPKKIKQTMFESIFIEPTNVRCKIPEDDIKIVVYLPNQIHCEINKGLTYEALPAFLKQLVSLC